MDITALFDDVDSAEHALVNLQSLGIFPSRYKIKALHINEGAGRGRAFAGGMSGAPGSPAGGSLNTTGAPSFAVADISPGGAFGGNEPPSREVQLLLTVEDPSAHRTQSALISNHARRVRVV